MNDKEIVSTKIYRPLLAGIAKVLNEARRQTARSVNAILTVTYWEIGRRIVEFEQRGKKRAKYGIALLERLSEDLTKKFGKGFSVDNLENMRLFYLAYPRDRISETLSRKLNGQRNSETPSRNLTVQELAAFFTLSWSHYILLVKRTPSDVARAFYETESLHGGWSVRQLDRQINSQFYERTALSKNKATMLKKGQKTLPQDSVTPEEEIKDPYVLEFLGLKDEYSESDLEQALIQHLESFLLELGSEFAFIARQKRLRVGDEWYRIDLVFYHRGLRCLVLIDLKIGKFTHADAGQMHLYLNYAGKHWTRSDENPPVGVILCSYKDRAVVKYALDGLPNKIMASEYKTILPDEKLLSHELRRTRNILYERSAGDLNQSKTKTREKKANSKNNG
jgi:predicted nuclease of restriction endonuclease-like (RecB) superfamily